MNSRSHPSCVPVSLAAGLLLCAAPAGTAAADGPATPPPAVSVAIFVDEGVWEDGVVAFEHAWGALGVSSARVTAGDIRGGALIGADILLVPGGWASDYAAVLGDDGFDAIRAFVVGGGGYLGVCAGAYLASSRVRWSGRPIRYGLDLVEVLAAGPIETIAPWPEYAMTQVQYEPHAITQGLPNPSSLLYYGGARFRPLPLAGVEVVAVYADPGSAPTAPAMVAGSYGDGRIFLTALHAEIEEGSPADGVTGWDDDLVDPESDWPLLAQALEWLLEAGGAGVSGS